MSEDFHPITDDEAEANIREFIDQHGLEGFMTVYFRQLIFRFTKQELQSAGADIDDVSVQMHLDDSGDEALQDKRERMRRACEEWARELVENLKEDDVVGEVIANDDFERLWDEGVQDQWQDQLHETYEEWREEAALDDVPADSQTTLSQDDSEDS